MMKEQHIEGVVDVIPCLLFPLLINYDPVWSPGEIKERIQKIVRLEVKTGEVRKRIFLKFRYATAAVWIGFGKYQSMQDFRRKR